MLGRGQLSILRQSPGSWPDRDNTVSTSGKVREDMVLMDGQLERESLLSRPQKYFSPPKRPWDFSKVCQPKRPWDFSPPFCQEVLQVNTLSGRGIEESREQYCGSFDGIRTVGGFSSHRLAPRSRCFGLTENGDAAFRAQSVSKSYIDQVDVPRGFWPTNPEPSPVEAVQSQDGDSQSRLLHQQVDSFAKAVTEQQSKASQLSAKVELEVQEIERLKAQLALLCERLAWWISHSSKGEGKAGIADSIASEEYLLLKGVGELKRLVGGAVTSAESFAKQGKEFQADYAGGNQVFEEVYSCRAEVWKIGLRTFLQAVLWYIGLIITILRCIDAAPCLTPT